MHALFKEITDLHRGVSADEFAASVRRDYDAPAFNEPFVNADIRELEAIAGEIWAVAQSTVAGLSRLTFGNAHSNPVSVRDLALSMAEALDPHGTSETVGIIYDEIKSLAARSDTKEAA